MSDKTTPREPGYYWVNYAWGNQEWLIAEYKSNDSWWLTGYPMAYSDFIIEIDERRIDRTAVNERDALKNTAELLQDQVFEQSKIMAAKNKELFALKADNERLREALEAVYNERYYIHDSRCIADPTWEKVIAALNLKSKS